MLAPDEEYQDIVGMLRAKAVRNRSKIALRFLSGDLTYEELDRGSDRVAAGLRERGIGKGNRVACLLGNRPEFPLLWFGVAKTGAVFVPLNTALHGELLRYELADCTPTAIVTDGDSFPAYEHVSDWGGAPSVWVIDGAYAGSPLAGDVERFSALANSGGLPPTEPLRPSEPASILYTSGTTGRPKGVVLPHRRLVNTPKEVGARAILTPESVLFTSLPLYHCNAQEKTTLVALLNDLTAAFDDRFHASSFWETASRFHATHVALLTTMISVLYKQPARPSDRTHAVRIATASGTPVGLWKEFEARFGVRIIESYGMTECGCTTLMNPPNAIRVGSVGLPFGFVEAQVVDEHDRPVPPDTPGELVVRPRVPFTMFLEYLGKPETTVAAWRNLWFHTGDLLRQDLDGYFYFIDRKGDVIRRRGENVAPFDVESALAQHPAVLECVAVGVPSELGEEDVKVFVQLKEGAGATAEELFRFAASALPFFMVPRYIEFVPTIPKTPNQKAQRFLLRGKITGREVDREALESRAPPAPGFVQ
ncbi:MAG: AMP-binding protein [Thermoplasmata archaeon]|nr:AMP-binding protein [Thermoplasmata archaeon]